MFSTLIILKCLNLVRVHSFFLIFQSTQELTLHKNLFTYVFQGAPPKHRVLEHQQPKHLFLNHRLPITSTVNNIDCRNDRLPKHLH